MVLKKISSSPGGCIRRLPLKPEGGRSLSFINDNTTPMKISGIVGGVFLLSSLILIVPAAATISLQDVQVTPAGDSIPVGDLVNASAMIQIIPQGPTTFIEGYTLVLSTDLENARWNAIVMVDGTQAAVIPNDGKFVFINGYLLSYPTNRDVAVSVQVEGDVPPLTHGTPFRVLQAEELNNQGQSIGDTEQVVVRSVENTGTEATASPTAGEATVVVTVPVPVTTTKAGISLIPVVGGLALVAGVFLRKGR
jgi:hypothetical protein